VAQQGGVVRALQRRLALLRARTDAATKEDVEQLLETRRRLARLLLAPPTPATRSASTASTN